MVFIDHDHVPGTASVGRCVTRDNTVAVDAVNVAHQSDRVAFKSTPFEHHDRPDIPRPPVRFDFRFFHPGETRRCFSFRPQTVDRSLYRHRLRSSIRTTSCARNSSEFHSVRTEMCSANPHFHRPGLAVVETDRSEIDSRREQVS